ncbi:protein kinase [Aestuariimicrobium sp. p3-SID1156]|uniref:serine/threonine-protein kinase n=1 Tax=Aestuariimicrobium sp. p3-SID1156 TaxID=2916038 RepID=UPI00223ADD32|nr:serine/threonine-protein kinase [Aestuariimicrobium sp. p3-SID1156]MCT1458415.1 protein kinase [Aestuariimicrobium sp. p3-SID1156]
MASPGRLGSRYQLEELIGRGGMGEVWRGTDDEGNALAFKVLHSHYLDDEDMLRRFISERRLLTDIDHPNLVKVHDLVLEGSTLAIVMELVEGGDLRRLIQQCGPLAPADIAAVGAQIAEGLAAIHAQRIVHRDIKPENVLIAPEPTGALAKITDFGVARLSADDLTVDRTTVVAGTPQYMAPEVVQGRVPTPQSDLYSLGLVLYELACGVTPFQGRSPAGVMYAQANDVPSRPVGVPDPLWEAIERLLHKEPTQRPSDARVVAHHLTTLRQYLTGLPAAPRLQEPPPSTPLSQPAHQVAAVPALPPARKRRFPWVVVLILLALLPAGYAASALVRPVPTEVDPPRPTPTASASPTPSPTHSTTQPTSETPTPSPTFPPSVKACTERVGVNENTTCPFAQNVARAWEAEGSRTDVVEVTAWSPAVRKDITMTCVPGQVVICTGGNRAAVYIKP